MPPFVFVINKIMVDFLKSPRTASRVFGMESQNQLLTAVPRMKFLFFVEFYLTPSAIAMTRQAELNSWQGNNGISFKVKSIDKPRVNLQVDELNMYNRRHLIHKKVDYQESSIKFHDTNDNSMLSLWVDYFTYFFGDSRPKNKAEQLQSPVAGTFLDGTGWGYRPLANDTNFFSNIRILLFFAQTVTSFRYMNPKITSIDWDSNDYSSNELETVNVNFKYEYLEYEAFGQPMGADAINGKYGWYLTDQKSIPLTGIIKPRSSQPRIFADFNPGTQFINENVAQTQTSQLVTRRFLNRERTINVATQRDNYNSFTSLFRPATSSGSFGGSTANFGPSLGSNSVLDL